MKGLWSRPIPCWVWLMVSLAMLLAMTVMWLSGAVYYDGMSGMTRAAIHELAAKGKADPSEVVRRLQEASDRLKKGTRVKEAVAGMLDINRGTGK